MTATPESFKIAWMDSLKAQPTLVAVVGKEIRETEYQSTDWLYPNVRVALEFHPSIIRCGPDDADVDIEVYSEEKSSKEADHIASLIYSLYQGKPFESNGIKFSTVIVRKVTKPERTIFSWVVVVKVFCQGV